MATTLQMIQKNESLAGLADISREVFDNDIHDEAGDDHSGDQDVGVTFRSSFDQSHHGVGHAEDRGNILKIVKMYKCLRFSNWYSDAHLRMCLWRNIKKCSVGAPLKGNEYKIAKFFMMDAFLHHRPLLLT